MFWLPLSGYLLGHTALAAAYCLALTGSGWLLLRLLVPRRDGIGVTAVVATSFSLGFGIVGSLWLLVGLAGWLRLPVLLAALAPGLAVTAWRSWRRRAPAMALCAQAWRGLRDPVLWVRLAAVAAVLALAATLGRASWRTALLVLAVALCAVVWRRTRLVRSVGAALRGMDVWLLAAVVAGVLAYLYVAAFQPPNGDAVAFYMAWPKAMAAAGRIVPLAGYEPFSAIWTLAEPHTAALLILGGEATAKIFVWFNGLAILGALWSIGGLGGLSVAARLVAFVVVLTSTGLTYVAIDGKTDLPSVAPALMAVYWLLRLADSPRWRTALVVGVCVGTAVAAKLTILGSMGLTVILVGLWAARAATPSWAAALRRVTVLFFWIGIGLLPVVIPQLIKNQLLFHFALLPIIAPSDGDVWALASEAWFSAPVVRRLLLTFPLALTFGDYWGQYGNLSPLALGLLPLFLLWRPRWAQADHQRLLIIGAAAVIGIAGWMALRPSQLAPRYFLASMVLLAVPVGWVAGQSALHRSRVVWLSILAACVVVAQTSLRDIKVFAALGYAYARSQADGGRGPYTPSAEQAMAEAVNRVAPPGSRIAFLGFYRYFLRADLLQCVQGHKPFQDAGERVSADMIGPLGLDFILVEKASFGHYAIDAQIGPVVFDDGKYRLYRAAGTAAKAVRCTDRGHGDWRAQAVREPG